MKLGLKKLLINSFNKLDIAERINMLVRKSTILITREQAYVISTLYEFKNIFVEVIIDKTSFELISVRAIDEEMTASKYLSHLHLVPCKR